MVASIGLSDGRRSRERRALVPVYRNVAGKGLKVFVTVLVFVILTELSAAVTQPHGPYIFRNALLELFQTSMGSVGLRYCCGKFCKNDED